MYIFSMLCQGVIIHKTMQTPIALEIIALTRMLSQLMLRVADLVTKSAPEAMIGFLMRL